ncbi:TadE/TadG family type IV pilus assembly protein [uncultured Pseudonocardia sp.]|jgi:Flp pilus assembly protein TadG|uniref:TadE/TadG family type IV pilus assembly protein n=1 Tax=uncultured Pseudonocardia sp. TaxID=211455 RepID=UPI0026054905|nr:TadE/TadG family type IV pilus assembly protein [uncultured Pseudonocardia sp.]
MTPPPNRTAPPPHRTATSPTAQRPDWGRWWRADRGSAATELTLLTPLLVMLLVLIAVVAYRVVDARLRLDSTAHQAARAASIERTATRADQAASRLATTALDSAGPSCADVGVRTDTSGFRPGGAVTVTVTCTVDLTGGFLLAVPGRTQVTATATEPVDVYRSTTDTP